MEEHEAQAGPLLLGGNDEGSGGSCPLHRDLEILGRQLMPPAVMSHFFSGAGLEHVKS